MRSQQNVSRGYRIFLEFSVVVYNRKKLINVSTGLKYNIIG
jgi:hypothetical protein